MLGGAGTHQEAMLSRFKGRAVLTEPSPASCSVHPAAPSASLQSSCGGHWLGGSTLVPSPGRHAGLSELGQIGAPGGLGPRSAVRPWFGPHRGPSGTLTGGGGATVFRSGTGGWGGMGGGRGLPGALVLSEPSRVLHPPTPRCGLGAPGGNKVQNKDDRERLRMLCLRVPGPRPPVPGPGLTEVSRVWGRAGG